MYQISLKGVWIVTDIRDLLIGTNVMAPIKGGLYPGVIVEPPADHPNDATMVCVKFMPPVPDGMTPNEWFNYISCQPNRVRIK
jgi:hypothetical protein